METMRRNPEAVAECIREARNIAVAAHVNPDGDTLGSATAIRLALISLGKEELNRLADEQETTEIVCHFCGTKYPFSAEEMPTAHRPERETHRQNSR